MLFRDGRRFHAASLDKLQMLLHVDETAGNDIRARDWLTRASINDRNQDDDAISGKLLTIAQNNLVGISNAETVNKHIARLKLLVGQHSVALFVELHDLTVVSDEDVFRIKSVFNRNLGVVAQERVGDPRSE
jgi:hypothetical protein